MKTSVVIPTLNEALILKDSLHAISNLDPHEIIVVDGGSTDATVSVAHTMASQVIKCKPGRARQMNAGAKKATGNLLLFMHADSKLTRKSFVRMGKVMTPKVEAIRKINSSIKFYNACSGECFGDTDGKAVNENSPFKPCSPYAIAKLSTYWQVKLYRKAYNLFACSGILFNHESPLRPKGFVTRKIISTAVKIANGSNEKLILGDLSIKRDWGWAPEYVNAMWMMLQLSSADDFVISTGISSSLEMFVTIVFEKLGLNWKEHVIVDKDLFRPSEIQSNRGDSSKAEKNLGWKAKYSISEIAQSMIDNEKKDFRQ